MANPERKSRIESIPGIGAGFVFPDQNIAVYNALYGDTETLREDIPPEEKFFIIEFAYEMEQQKVYILTGTKDHITGKKYLEKLQSVMKNSELRLYDLNAFEVRDQKYLLGTPANCFSISSENTPELLSYTALDDL